MKKTSTHISFERLADLAEHRLDTENERAALEHLSACDECAGQLTAVERVTRLMREDVSEDAPRDVIFNALRLFDARRASKSPGLLRRLAAALVFDSASERPAYGLRSGQTAAARQLLFSAGDDRDVDLRLTPEPDGWRIRGQILGECEGGGRVELFAVGRTRTAASADVNELCEFSLDTVPEGEYTLRLTVGIVEIEVGSLTLGDDDER